MFLQNPHSPNISEQLSTFLNEFKAMFNQLTNQNSMVLNMLNNAKSQSGLPMGYQITN
jgi:hypothetical protein